jgi:hypothetical protein
MITLLTLCWSLFTLVPEITAKVFMVKSEYSTTTTVTILDTKTLRFLSFYLSRMSDDDFSKFFWIHEDNKLLKKIDLIDKLNKLKEKYISHSQ